MRTLLVGLALVLAAPSTPALAKGGSAGAKKSGKGSAPEADPNAVVAKAHGGKVWIVTGATPSSEGEDLSKWLASHPSVTELTKKPNEERWPVT
jgi:DNA-binding protein H-NS